MPQYNWWNSRVASYHVSMQLNVRGDSFMINNVGLNVTQLFEGCPTYHSSCLQIWNAENKTLSGKETILARMCFPFRQSLSVLLCVLEGLLGMPVTRPALLSYFPKAGCLKASLTLWSDLMCLTKATSFSERRDQLSVWLKCLPQLSLGRARPAGRTPGPWWRDYREGPVIAKNM